MKKKESIQEMVFDYLDFQYSLLNGSTLLPKSFLPSLDDIR